ncbi:protein-tyrosine-phosphatase ibr5 [Phtheirospermum japonicum]|uniref:Protein-tyrosine-phosphatase ibr5 n=1 Tax=Phtheirospermum japonicum TaxID=374723 RepID=A0A830CJS6_9LAMI|nr:protein-tyrosine-phosphatase ibr5 [Phtheirospermum japonicum]
MSGKNRSPAIVMAFLMKSKGWKLAQCYQWVKERKPSAELNQAVYEQLQEYEQKIFGTAENNNNSVTVNSQSFSFGFSRPNDPPLPVPVFINNTVGASIFSHAPFDVPPQEFTFGAGHTQKNTSDETPFNTNTNIPAVNYITMDGS